MRGDCSCVMHDCEISFRTKEQLNVEALLEDLEYIDDVIPNSILPLVDLSPFQTTN